MNTAPLPPSEGLELDYDKLIADAFANHKYRQGTRECVAFKNGAHWAMHNYATQARADLEAENKRLRELLGKANALARIRFEHIRHLQGREAVEDNSDCHGPDWTDRESEYLK